jgi:hypothetical protein
VCPRGDSHNGTRGDAVCILDAAHATLRPTALWCAPQSWPLDRHCSTGVRQRTLCGSTLPGRAWTARWAEPSHREIVLPWPAGAIVSGRMGLRYECARFPALLSTLCPLPVPCSLLPHPVPCSLFSVLRSLVAARCPRAVRDLCPLIVKFRFIQPATQ